MDAQQKKALEKALPALKKEGVLSGSAKYINPIRKQQKATPAPKKKGFWQSLFD